MHISDLNPHIRHARLHKEAFQTSTQPSVCYDCRLFYFDNISGMFETEKEKYNIINKTAVFLPPETEYKFNVSFKEDATLIIFNFDLTNRNSHLKNSLGTATKTTFQKELVPPYTPFSELSSPIIRELPNIERMLVQCIDNFILKNACYRESSSALLKMCLLELIKQDTGNAHSELCKNVLAYLHENYSDVSLKNEDISAKFNYHPYHLSNIIKEETGKTLHQFLIYYRLRNARDLLITTRYSIAEIAWRSGFDSPAYFTKMFKKNVGITPKDYRRQYMNVAF